MAWFTAPSSPSFGSGDGWGVGDMAVSRGELRKDMFFFCSYEVNGSLRLAF
jgi:hypothetical protein